MKIQEAKRAILLEWEAWDRNSSSETWSDKYRFFTWLAKSKPELLAFQVSGDKWQRIKCWLPD